MVTLHLAFIFLLMLLGIFLLPNIENISMHSLCHFTCLNLFPYLYTLLHS